MKYTALAVLAGAATAEFQNSVPIVSTLPGWVHANHGQVHITFFYDMLCPYSKELYYLWKSMKDQESPALHGKPYGELVYMETVPLVLPYHLHSWEMTKIFVLLNDICDADSSKCYQDQYTELCFDHQDSVKDTNTSEVDFMNKWSKTVADELSIDQQEILDLFGKNDTHNSEER